jgi:thioredoxin-related protein
MKKIATLVLFATIVLAGCTKNTKQTSAVHWLSVKEAVSLNKEKPKLIYVCLYTDWCKWCHTFDSATFSDPDIAGYLNDNFYAVRLDAETSDTILYNNVVYTNPYPTKRMWHTHKFAEFLLAGKQVYPASVFIDGHGNTIGSPTYGYYPPHDFKILLSYYTSGKYNTITFDEYKRSL